MSAVSIAERVDPIIEACAPLKVNVKFRSSRDKYYIDFDGSATYKNPTDWDQYWVSFVKYVESLVRNNGFSVKNTVVKGPAKCTIFVGSLFDFLVTVDARQEE